MDDFEFDDFCEDEGESIATISSKQRTSKEPSSLYSRSNDRSTERHSRSQQSSQSLSNSQESTGSISTSNPSRSTLTRTRHRRLGQKQKLKVSNGENKSTQSRDETDSSEEGKEKGQSPNRRVHFLIDSSQRTAYSSLTRETATTLSAAENNLSPQSSTATSAVSSVKSRSKGSRTRSVRSGRSSTTLMTSKSSSSSHSSSQSSSLTCQSTVSNSQRGALSSHHSLEAAKTSAVPFALSRRRLLGVGMGVNALKEMGEYEFLHDEFSFLCGSLIKIDQPSPQATLRTASDLLLLLSSHANRRTLFFQGNSLRRSNDSALGSLLRLFGSCASATSENDSRQLPFKRQREDLEETEESMHTNNSSDHKLLVQNDDKYRTAVLDAMSLALYFLSLDCTLSEAGAANGCARTAQRIRHEILSHPTAMAGILHLVRSEPLLANLRDQKHMVSVPSMDIVINNTASDEKDGDGISNDDDDDSSRMSFTVSTEQSFGMSSQSTNTPAVGFVDPTKAGRHRRKRRRIVKQSVKGALAAIPENGLRDTFSFPSNEGTSTSKSIQEFDDKSSNDLESVTSTDSQAIKTRHNMDVVMARVMMSMPSQNATGETLRLHSCPSKMIVDERIIGDTVHSVPLVALSRILKGKSEWCDKSCLDGDDNNNSIRGFASSTNSSRSPKMLDNDEDEDDIPLFKTNRLLAETGSVPLLSQALAETLAAVIQQLRNCDQDDYANCGQCISFLQERVTALTSLVDEACLMNDSNRLGFCQEGYTPESGGYLIVGLVTVLKLLLDKNKLFDETSHQNKDCSAWSEIGFETLRSLTSLTHENEIATKELESKGINGDSDDSTGLSVLIRILHKAVSKNLIPQKHQTTQLNKIRYDSVIFCLNSLTNCIESSKGSTSDLLAKATTPATNGEACNFLTWLTRWLVDETASFREAIQSHQSERRLEKHEEERLVTAGNGFVLLACLIVQSAQSQNKGFNARELILAELPGDCLESKVAFVESTLKAFCNFYQYSIGDLSVAVVEPVKQLIAQISAVVHDKENSENVSHVQHPNAIEIKN